MAYSIEQAGKMNRIDRYRPYLGFERLESRCLLASDWQNALLYEDVNKDGAVHPIDAILVINEINLRTVANTSGELLPLGGASPPAYYDINGDWFLGPIDALLVVNLLNEMSEPMGAARILSEDAEGGLTNVVDRTSDSYPLIQLATVFQGSNAFHMAHPNASSESFELNRTVRPLSDSNLYFMSKLNSATSTQIAKVQISTDGGNSWPTTVFTQAGIGSGGDRQFALRQVSLSTFAGQDIRIRFLYDYTGGSWFNQTNANTGWFVDDIRIASRFETLAYSIGEPTNSEQLLLELTNRGRADAIIEANRLVTAFSSNPYGVDPNTINPSDIIGQYSASVQNGFLDRYAQPLAFNAKLLAAARLHSTDMLNEEFQGHVSSTNPPAPFLSGFNSMQRAAALGYQVGEVGIGENAFASASSVDMAHAFFAIDWGRESPLNPSYNPAFAGQGMQNPAGHRRNLHDGDFNEAGFAVVLGTNGSIGPQVITQDFGSSRAPIITGVVFKDLDLNQFYSVNEGRGNVRIEVEGAVFHAISSSSGGFAIPVAGDGEYRVTFSGPGIATSSKQVVVSNGANVKVDYVL